MGKGRDEMLNSIADDDDHDEGLYHDGHGNENVKN